MEQTISGKLPIQYQNNQHNVAKKTNGGNYLPSMSQPFNIDDKVKAKSAKIASNIEALSNQESEKLLKDDENQSQRRRRRRTNNGCGLFGHKRYNRRTGLYK